MTLNTLKSAIFFTALISVFIFAKNSSAQTANRCYCENINTGSATCLLYPSPSGGGCTTYSGYTCVSDPQTQQECETAVRDATSAGRGASQGQGEQSSEESGGVMSKILPECVFKDKLEGECTDVTVFLILMFNIINYLFGIIGGVALLFFVYGGFVFILSQGSAEKVAKGKSIIVAAVLGIIIAFSGYALVRFVGEVADISDQFKLQ